MLPEQERTKEEIKFHTEVGRVCAATLVVTLGGTMSMIFSVNASDERNFFMTLGLLASGVLLIFVIKKYFIIEKILNDD